MSRPCSENLRPSADPAQPSRDRSGPKRSRTSSRSSSRGSCTTPRVRSRTCSTRVLARSLARDGRHQVARLGRQHATQRLGEGDREREDDLVGDRNGSEKKKKKKKKITVRRWRWRWRGGGDGRGLGGFPGTDGRHGRPVLRWFDPRPDRTWLRPPAHRACSRAWHPGAPDGHRDRLRLGLWGYAEQRLSQDEVGRARDLGGPSTDEDVDDGDLQSVDQDEAGSDEHDHEGGQRPSVLCGHHLALPDIRATSGAHVGHTRIWRRARHRRKTAKLVEDDQSVRPTSSSSARPRAGPTSG